jgi:flagellar motor switch protein FliN/FliY
MGSETPDEEFELNDFTISAVCEVMNQMMGAASTALSDFLGKPVNISPPQSFEVHNFEEFKAEHFHPIPGKLVVVRFILSIEGHLRSEFINIITVELARELIAGFGLDPEPSPQPTPEPPSTSSSNTTLSQDEIERLMAIATSPSPQPQQKQHPHRNKSCLPMPYLLTYRHSKYLQCLQMQDSPILDIQCQVPILLLMATILLQATILLANLPVRYRSQR